MTRMRTLPTALLVLATLLGVPLLGGQRVLAVERLLGGLAVAVTADGSRVVAGGDARVLYDLDPKTLAVKRRVHLGWEVLDMAFAPDGKSLVVESTAATHVLESGSLRIVKTLERFTRMSVAAEAGLVAVEYTAKNVVRIISMADGSEKAAVEYGRGNNLAAFGIDPQGKRLALLHYRKKDAAEKKVPYNEVPKDLRGAARREWEMRNDGYTARFQVIDIATGKPTLDKTLWFTARSRDCRAIWSGEVVYLITYPNENAKVDAAGEATYFVLENKNRIDALTAASDGSVFLTGGLRGGVRTLAKDMQATPFDLKEILGYPENIKGLSIARDGTGFAGTSAHRVIRIEADGSISKIAPVY